MEIMHNFEIEKNISFANRLVKVKKNKNKKLCMHLAARHDWQTVA